ncbi:MAG: 23S rRNA (pseudouridine(1915)-N(3))-methyltransferase RlmH [Wujia sp.]
MKILISLCRKKLDPDYKKAMEEYIKRVSPFCNVQLRLCRYASELICNDTKGITYIVAPGEDSMTSTDLARHINELNVNGCSLIHFIIPDDPDPVPAEVTRFFLSSFTMDTELTAVVLTEQIYRAYTILNHITYHK